MTANWRGKWSKTLCAVIVALIVVIVIKRGSEADSDADSNGDWGRDGTVNIISRLRSINTSHQIVYKQTQQRSKAVYLHTRTQALAHTDIHYAHTHTIRIHTHAHTHLHTLTGWEISNSFKWNLELVSRQLRVAFQQPDRERERGRRNGR